VSRGIEADGGRATKSFGPFGVPRLLGTAALTCGVIAAAAMLVPALLGFQRYVITGDSMDGTYDRGSIVYSRVVPADQLRVGDVITYDPPGESGGGGLVTHRISSLKSGPRGQTLVRTRGDANGSADPGLLRLGDTGQARAELAVPYLGYAFAALGIREVRMLAIGVPAALIALALLTGLWRDAGAEVRRLARGEP
jgi:signal peptidase